MSETGDADPQAGGPRGGSTALQSHVQWFRAHPFTFLSDLNDAVARDSRPNTLPFVFQLVRKLYERT